jgi:hypothetical protein
MKEKENVNRELLNFFRCISLAQPYFPLMLLSKSTLILTLHLLRINFINRIYNRKFQLLIHPNCCALQFESLLVLF